MAFNVLKKNNLISEINITPFTDVLLVLLIIFMVTTPIMMQAGIPVKLPKSQAMESFAENQGSTVVITSKDRIYFDNVETDREKLGGILKNKLLNDPELLVIIKADAFAYHEWVVDVLDVAKQAGVKRIAIATEMKAEKENTDR